MQRLSGIPRLCGGGLCLGALYPSLASLDLTRLSQGDASREASLAGYVMRKR